MWGRFSVARAFIPAAKASPRMIAIVFDFMGSLRKLMFDFTLARSTPISGTFPYCIPERLHDGGKVAEQHVITPGAGTYNVLELTYSFLGFVTDLLGQSTGCARIEGRKCKRQCALSDGRKTKGLRLRKDSDQFLFCPICSYTDQAREIDGCMLLSGFVA